MLKNIQHTEHNPSLNNKLNRYITIHWKDRVLELNRNMHSPSMHETNNPQIHTFRNRKKIQSFSNSRPKIPSTEQWHNPSLNTKFNKLNKYIRIHCQSKVLELNRNMHSSAMHETQKFTHPGTEKRFNLFPPANLQFLVPIDYSKKHVSLVHYFRTKS